MLSRLMAATARHRRLILSCELLVALAVVVLDPGRHFFPWAIAVVLVGLALAIAAVNRRQAALVLESEPPAFGTPVNPGPVFLFGAYVPIMGSNVGTSLRNVAERDELWQLDLVVVVLCAVALGLLIRATWVGQDFQLRRDGVVHRTAVGSLVVPWEAFALDQPAYPGGKDGQVAFTYRRPELVRRRGLPRGWELRTVTGVDVWFLSRVIHHYVTHPEHRAAIGTEGEYRRLRESLELTPEPR
ncbi:hypothetical protein [Actinoplanes sp. NPDC049316]|uniref:hypothetical protein n=1 Tax=Actinoplanes sp. NPDC049316 TaxID=3154727 RepID=UPI0034466DEF